MYFIENRGASRLPFFVHLPLNTYLSVVCIAAVAMERGVLKYIYLCRFVFSKKCKLRLIAVFINSSYTVAVNNAFKTARYNPQKYLPPPPL
jgi:hypothetical protein